MGFRISPAVRYLLIVNVSVFFLGPALFGGGVAGYERFIELFGLKFPTAAGFMPWQVVTHMFLHAGIGHLFHNMLPLLFLAPLLEQVMDTKRFLVFYLVCGMGAALLFTGVNAVEFYQMKADQAQFERSPTPSNFKTFVLDHPLPSTDPRNPQNRGRVKELLSFADDKFAREPNNPAHIAQARGFINTTISLYENVEMVGASGAVFAILMAFFLLFPELELMLLFIPIPIKAKYLIGAYFLYEVYVTSQDAVDDNVAHFAHIGGALFGALLIWYYRKKGWTHGY